LGPIIGIIGILKRENGRVVFSGGTLE